ncbi:MAG: hypothetical protein IJZ79_02220 [Bacilli bacterium]|nr:hypothetical protein [Bacilli bacterium]
MLTEELVNEFNEELRSLGCMFRYKYYTGLSIPSMEIEPISMTHIDSYIINVTDEFRTWMYDWFRKRGEELNCNNTGSILWSYKGD